LGLLERILFQISDVNALGPQLLQFVNIEAPSRPDFLPQLALLLFASIFGVFSLLGFAHGLFRSLLHLPASLLQLRLLFLLKTTFLFFFLALFLCNFVLSSLLLIFERAMSLAFDDLHIERTAFNLDCALALANQNVHHEVAYLFRADLELNQTVITRAHLGCASEAI